MAPLVAALNDHLSLQQEQKKQKKTKNQPKDKQYKQKNKKETTEIKPDHVAEEPIREAH